MGPPRRGVGIFRLLGRCIGPMSYREVSVIEIVEMLRLWLQGWGLREVARLSGTDRKTVRRYVDRARACGLDRDGGDGQLTDGLIAAVIAGVRPSRPTGKSLPWETIAAEHEQTDLAPVLHRPAPGNERSDCRLSLRQFAG